MKRKDVGAESWATSESWTLHNTPVLVRLGGPFGPGRVGKLVHKTDNRVIPVYQAGSPCPTIRQGSVGSPSAIWTADTILLQDAGGPHIGARALEHKEAWKLQGGTDAGWTVAKEEGTDVGKLLAWAARTIPPKLASEVITRAVTRAQLWGEHGKAGVCKCNDEGKLWSNLQSWLRAWKEDPLHPADVWERWREAEGDLETGKCGAPPKKKKGVAIPCQPFSLARTGRGDEEV